MQNLFAHLQTFHPKHHTFTIPILGEVTNSSKVSFSLRDEFNETMLKTERFKVFINVNFLKLGLSNNLFFQCIASIYDQELTFRMFYLGPPQDAEKYSYELRLSKLESERKIIVTGPSVSVAVYWKRTQFYWHSFRILFTEIKSYWQTTDIEIIWEVKVFESDLPIIENVRRVKIVKIP